MVSPISQTQEFSVDLLNDREKLKDYFSGKEHLSTIRNQLQQPQRDQPSSWRAGILFCLCILLPSRLLLRNGATVGFFNTVGLKRVNNLSKVVLDHLAQDRVEIFSSLDKSCIVPATNCPQLRDYPTYMHRDIPTNQIKDPLIRAHTRSEFSQRDSICFDAAYFSINAEMCWICLKKGYPLQLFISGIKAVAYFVKFKFKKACIYVRGEIPQKQFFYEAFDALIESYSKFYPWWPSHLPRSKWLQAMQHLEDTFPIPKEVSVWGGGGVCRGATEYFTHLCLQLEKLGIPLTPKALEEVARVFKNGVPSQGVVAQSLPNLLLSCFKYETTRMGNHAISCDQLDRNSKTAIKTIEKLQPGIYFVYVLHHAFVYIKFKDGTSYVWDSNFGLLKHSAKQLFHHVIHHYHKKGEKDSHILFRHISAPQRWFPFSRRGM